MSHPNYIQGIVIYCDRLIEAGTQAAREAIGLYNDHGTVSEFRFVESPISGLTVAPTTWLQHVIVSLGEDGQGGDHARGGNVWSLDGFDITLVNTFQFYQKCVELGISFDGLRCQLVEFVGTDAAGEGVSRDILRTGRCQEPTWGEPNIVIPVKCGSLNRRANIVTVINNDPLTGNYKNADNDLNGKAIPASFGQFNKSTSTVEDVTKAKFVRTANAETILTNDQFAASVTTPGLKSFPIVGWPGHTPNIPMLQYAFVFDSVSAWHGWGTESLINKYMRVIDGSKSSGEARLITAATGGFNEYPPGTTGQILNCIIVTIDKYFTDNLIGSVNADAEFNAWVEIVDIDQSYSADVWPCIGPLDEASLPSIVAATDAQTKLYSYDAPQTGTLVGVTAGSQIALDIARFSYWLIPLYAYKMRDAINGNAIDINACIFNSGTDKVESVFVFPVANPRWCTDANLTHWGNASLVAAGPDGMFISSAYGTKTASFTGALANLITSDPATYYQATFQSQGDGAYHSSVLVSAALIFDMPQLPSFMVIGDNSSFDAVYLGLNLDISQSVSGPQVGVLNAKLYLRLRRFYGPSTIPLNDTVFGGGQYQDGVARSVADIPDFYFNLFAGDMMGFFATSQIASLIAGGDLRYTGGHENFDLGITTLAQYNAVYQACLQITANWTGDEYDTGTQVYKYKKLCIMLAKGVSIKDAIYASFAGRIFNDTWGLRRTAANLINDPVDILEHNARCQNWQESPEDPPAVGWGKSYGATALIKTSGDGSFDDAALTDIRTLRPTRQITSEGDGWTDTVGLSLCRQYWMAQYQDGAGYECVRPLFYAGSAQENVTARQATPPVAPGLMSRYIVAPSGTGAWAGHDNYITVWNGSAWAFYPENATGDFAYSTTEKIIYVYSLSSGWSADTDPLITLDNIMGEPSAFKEPTPQDIFCEPVVNYQWDEGAQKFNKQLRILNAGLASFDGATISNCAQGFQSEADASAAWQKAHTLYGKCQTIETPPSDMTDCKWINDYAGALWYLNKWLDWMFKLRCGFSVDYLTGRLWMGPKAIKLILPHQTAGRPVRCLLEKIQKSKKSGTVSVDVVVLDSIRTTFYTGYNLQNSIDDQPTSLQDSIDDYATRGSGRNDMQNETNT